MDDYATVPHESIERMLALHRTGKLSVQALGDNYDIRRNGDKAGVVVVVDGEETSFDAFIDATGQHAMSASDLPFPSLRKDGALKEARTRSAGPDALDVSRRTGGIDIDDSFRPLVEAGVTNQLYCVSVPFLLHKLPFVQGITSAHEMGTKVWRAILETIENGDLILDCGRADQSTEASSLAHISPSAPTSA